MKGIREVAGAHVIVDSHHRFCSAQVVAPESNFLCVFVDFYAGQSRPDFSVLLFDDLELGMVAMVSSPIGHFARPTP